MAIKTTRSSFLDDQAWFEIAYDDVALQIVSVTYQNQTDKTIVAHVSQPPNRNDTFTVAPNTPQTTQNVPPNRYTYHIGTRGAVAPDFTYSLEFS